VALHPVLLDLIGDPRGKTVLDFGCGDAAVTWALAEQGATRVVGLDSSAEMIAAARKRGVPQKRRIRDRVELHSGDELRIATLPRFDIIVCSLVLMMMAEREQLERTIGDLVGRLETDGRLYLGLTHPCFRSSRHSTFYNHLPERFDYWSSGTPYEVHLHSERIDNGVVLIDYHWTLQDVLRSLRPLAAVVADCVEIGTQPDDDGGFTDDPAYLLLEIRCC